MTNYILYAKFPSQDGKGHFEPLDWKNGWPVVNLIHATLFNESEAKQALSEAQAMNQHVKFELRKAE